MIFAKIKGYLALAGGAVLAVAAAFVWGIFTGKNIQRADSMRKELKDRQYIDKKRHQISQMSDDELTKELEEKWTRR